MHAAIQAHPILLNRPIVVTDKGAKLCRPSDVALDLLPDELPDVTATATTAPRFSGTTRPGATAPTWQQP